MTVREKKVPGDMGGGAAGEEPLVVEATFVSAGYAADAVEAQFKDGGQTMPPGLKKQAETWRTTAQRYETEPETGEGRKELAARAKAKEAARDKAMSAYHMFEYGSAALQLAIVLAGAAALTSVVWLTIMSIGLGVVGMLFGALGFLAPTLIHL